MYKVKFKLKIGFAEYDIKADSKDEAISKGFALIAKLAEPARLVSAEKVL